MGEEAEEPVRGVRNWVGFPGREPVSLLRDKGPHGYKYLPDQPTNFLSSSCLEVGAGMGRSYSRSNCSVLREHTARL